MSSFIAVCWALGNAFRYKIIVASVIYYRRLGYNPLSSHEHGARDESPADIFALHSMEKLGMAIAMLKYLCQPGRRRYWTGVSFIWVAVVAFISMTALSIWMSALVMDDSTALWSSEHCGVYDYDESNGESGQARNDIDNLNKEAKAGDYAKSCYSPYGPYTPFDVSYPMRCDTFYRPSIKFKNKTTPHCGHFPGSICKPGTLSITFDTGITDSSELGLNVKTPYKFRREATCSVLNLDNHVEKVVEGNGTTKYYYNYGRKYAPATNHTFYTIGTPFDAPASGYSVK